MSDRMTPERLSQIEYAVIINHDHGVYRSMAAELLRECKILKQVCDTSHRDARYWQEQHSKIEATCDRQVETIKAQAEEIIELKCRIERINHPPDFDPTELAEEMGKALAAHVKGKHPWQPHEGTPIKKGGPPYHKLCQCLPGMGPCKYCIERRAAQTSCGVCGETVAGEGADCLPCRVEKLESRVDNEVRFSSKWADRVDELESKIAAINECLDGHDDRTDAKLGLVNERLNYQSGTLKNLEQRFDRLSEEVSDLLDDIPVPVHRKARHMRVIERFTLECTACGMESNTIAKSDDDGFWWIEEKHKPGCQYSKKGRVRHRVDTKCGLEE